MKTILVTNVNRPKTVSTGPTIALRPRQQIAVPVVSQTSSSWAAKEKRAARERGFRAIRLHDRESLRSLPQILATGPRGENSRRRRVSAGGKDVMHSCETRK